MKRREFVQKSSTLLLGSTFYSIDLSRTFSESLYIGICADVHKDLVPDADQRLQAFISEASQRKVDFIIQLGDFCTPIPENQGFLDIFHSFDGPRYHVIGNHDMDGGFEKSDTLKFWGIKSRYYSFDSKGFHFITLDGTVGPYPWTPDEEQLDWLDQDLQQTSLPTIVFIHQPLDAHVLSNADAIRSLLEKHKQHGKNKVIACFQGHNHTDYHKLINAIPYIEINSMSYFWLGPKYAKPAINPQQDTAFPAMKYYTRYKDSLYCFVKIKKSGHIMVEGKSSAFIDGTPTERGYPVEAAYPQSVTATISHRNIKP